VVIDRYGTFSGTTNHNETDEDTTWQSKEITGVSVDRTTSLGLWSYAKDFDEAARIVASKDEQRVSIPAYYLICHAIELALKAFLRGSGATLTDLRQLGHDLNKCFDRALSYNLLSYCGLSVNQQTAIKMMAEYYGAKELEYIVTGFKRFPEIEVLLSASATILDGITGFCFSKRGLFEREE